MKVVAFEFLDRQPAFSPVEALTVCKRLAEKGLDRCPHNRQMRGNCGHLVACSYGFSALGFNDAASAWHGAPKKLRRSGLDKMVEAPAGALVFWTGGSQGFGHVGIADGKGNVFGTDLPDDNRMGRFPTAAVTQRFTQLEPAGWTFPFFGAAASDNRRPPKLPGTPEDQPHQVIARRLVESQQDVVAAAKRGLLKDPPRELELAYLDVIRQAKVEIQRMRDLMS